MDFPKYFFIFFLLSISSNVIGQDLVNPVHNIGKYDLTGAVKSVDEKQYNYYNTLSTTTVYSFDKSGVLNSEEIIKKIADGNSHWLIEYDDRGVEESLFSMSNSKVKSAYYENIFNSKGNLLSQKMMSADGNPIANSQWQYDQMGRVSLHESYYQSVKMLNFLYEYNDAKNEIVLTTFNDLNAIEFKLVSVLNGKKEKISSTNFDKNDQQVEAIFYEWNKNSHCTKKKIEWDLKSETEIYTYKYDSNNNWIEKIIHSNDVIQSSTVRTITYY